MPNMCQVAHMIFLIFFTYFLLKQCNSHNIHFQQLTSGEFPLAQHRIFCLSVKLGQHCLLAETGQTDHPGRTDYAMVKIANMEIMIHTCRG